MEYRNPCQVDWQLKAHRYEENLLGQYFVGTFLFQIFDFYSVEFIGRYLCYITNLSIEKFAKKQAKCFLFPSNVICNILLNYTEAEHRYKNVVSLKFVCLILSLYRLDIPFRDSCTEFFISK